MPSTLLIRRRIRSVKSTHKITRAMELVSSAKMKRAQDAVLQSRPYASETWALLDRILPTLTVPHPLLAPRAEVKRVTFVVFSSDRGLCGSFNVNVLRKVLESLTTVRQEYPNAELEWVSMGRKVRQALRSTVTAPLLADFPKPDRAATVADILPLRTLLIDRYLSGSTDRVVLVYTDFVSALLQKARVQQVLPFPALHSAEAFAAQSGLGQTDRNVEISKCRNIDQEYLFEPTAQRLADTLLPSMVDLVLYQALLESSASEHAARRMAMKNATEAAEDIVDDLTLSYNQTRQASITQEIAEISTATAAMAG